MYRPNTKIWSLWWASTSHSQETQFADCGLTLLWNGSHLALYHSANSKHWTNVVLMLGQHRRRWYNIKAPLSKCLLFVGSCPANTNVVSMLGQRRRRLTATDTILGEYSVFAGGNMIFYKHTRLKLSTGNCRPISSMHFYHSDAS